LALYKLDQLLLLGLLKERPSQKMLAVWLPKRGSWSQVFHAWTAETGDDSATACVVIFPLAIRKHHNSHNAVLCEDRFAKTDAYTLISHKDSHAVPGTPHMLKISRSLVKTANATSKVGQTANWIRILTEAT